MVKGKPSWRSGIACNCKRDGYGFNSYSLGLVKFKIILLTHVDKAWR